jgi:hypothetical protein
MRQFGEGFPGRSFVKEQFNNSRLGNIRFDIRHDVVLV